MNRYSRRRENLKKALENYRNMPPEAPIRQLLDRTMAFYNDLCAQEGTEAERRYRIFTRRYISGSNISNRDSADYEYITVRTLYKDIQHVFDDLMVLIYGVDGIDGFMIEDDCNDIRQRIEAEIRQKVTNDIMTIFGRYMKAGEKNGRNL